MSEEKPEPTEFPVDAGPLLRAVAILIAIFVALCVLVYLQRGGEFYGEGMAFLAFVFCFSAYTQRADTFRMTSILVGGALLCAALYFVGGGGDEAEPANRSGRPVKQPSQPAPEGLGAQ